ncbi:hypothetical protein [Actinoplanes solisilvae]|uniref:hypothetical protein n=1 Tax=Actinoplanes solisilvae TaxID=2486853 RepID=UPI000FD74CB6|nr:hypothetical protein [Actinoplanes solisilvae]
MQSSSTMHSSSPDLRSTSSDLRSTSLDLVADAPVETEPQPALTPLIMIETTDESGVCNTDGWCV